MLKKSLANILCLLFVVWAGLSADPFTKELAVNLSIAPVMNIAWTDATGAPLDDVEELSLLADPERYEATVYVNGNTNLAGQIDIIITGEKYLVATDSAGNDIGQIPISITFDKNEGDTTPSIDGAAAVLRLSAPDDLPVNGSWNWTIKNKKVKVSALKSDVDNAPTVYRSSDEATQYTGELRLIIQSV